MPRHVLARTSFNPFELPHGLLRTCFLGSEEKRVGVARGDAGQTRPGGVLARWFADGGANVLLSAEVLAERHRAAETDHQRSEFQQAAAAEYSLDVELSTMLEGRER